MGAWRAAFGSCETERRHLVHPGGVSSRGGDKLLASETLAREKEVTTFQYETQVGGGGYSQDWGGPGRFDGKPSQPGTLALRRRMRNLSSVVLAEMATKYIGPGGPGSWK